MLNFLRLVGDNLEFSKGIEDCDVEFLIVEDRKLMAQAKFPEQWRDGQVDLSIVDNGFCHDGATKSVDVVNLLDFFLREGSNADWRWEKRVVRCLSPHLQLSFIIDLDSPFLELISDVVVELQSWSKTFSLFSLELKFQERSLIYLSQ